MKPHAKRKREEEMKNKSFPFLRFARQFYEIILILKNSAGASAGAMPSAARCSPRAGWCWRITFPSARLRRRRPRPRQGRHPNLDVGRAVASGHVRSQAGGGLRLLRAAQKPIETNVPGIKICELLPLLAKQADKYSIIRSMTHGNNGHETAAYIVQTGRKPGGGWFIRASARWCRCSKATMPATRA